MLNGFAPIFSPFGSDIHASDVVQQGLNCIVREVKKLDMQHVLEDGSDVTPVAGRIQAVLDNPNPLMSPTDFIEKFTWQVLLTYNGFIIPTWDSRGMLEELYPVYPTQVEFLQDARGDYYVKMWFINGKECTLRYEDIIHIRYNYSINEFMGGDEFGHPNHDSLLKTLELNNSMLEGVRKAMETSFNLTGIVKYNTMMDQGKTDKAMKELTDALKRNESGFMGIDLKSEFIPITRSIQMVDSETLKFIDEKILRNFGVPLCILTGDYSKDQYESFFQKTIEPLIKSFSQAFTKALFSKRESNGYGHKIMFYPKDLIFLNTTQKLEMIRLLGDSGALFENEKRVMMGLKPLPELKGVRKMSLNYVDVEIADQYQVGGQSIEQVPIGTDVPTTDPEVQDAVTEAVEEVEDIKKEPLLVGQIQALGDIIAGYSAGTYTYNQAKNMLMIGVGLSDEEAERLLDKQEDIVQEVNEDDEEVQ